MCSNRSYGVIHSISQKKAPVNPEFPADENLTKQRNYVFSSKSRFAENHRQQSLNPDIAELFKPIIIDRLIFPTVSRHVIATHKHFIRNENGAVLLNREGKNIFPEAFREKLCQTLDVSRG